MDMRLAASDAAVFLDMPRLTCLRRVIERRFRYRRTPRPDMAAGCPERLERQFLKYVWDYPKTRRPGILRKLESLPEEKETFVLRSPGEVRDFLLRVAGTRNTGTRNTGTRNTGTRNTGTRNTGTRKPI
jgi:adenylate kinase family enzyme